MANISQVYLLDTPLEDDLKHTLYFANATAQHTYMANNIVKSYVNVSYQRDTSTFRCPEHIDSIRQCNYMMYQNTAYSNKWFYCFIEKMTYISDGLTDVEFKVDPIQTFMFDFETQPSFIEREHTNDDTVGSNLVPENLELGDYVSNGDVTQVGYGGVNRYILNTNYYPDNTTILATNLNGLPIAGGIIGFSYWQQMNNAIQTISAQSHLSGIVSAFVVPDDLVDNFDNNDWQFHGTTDENIWYSHKGTTAPYFKRKVISAPTSINGYSPRNAKLLSAPYQFCMLVNNNGTVNSLQYEYFSNRNAFVIEAKGTIGVGCSIEVYPENYKGVEKNYNEGISQGKFPTLSWSGDAYTNWLTQNAVNLGIGVGATALTAVGNLALGNVVGATASALGGVTSAVSQYYQASLMPDQAKGNTNLGDLNYSKCKNKFTIYHMSIKPEIARVVDDYWDMFGYPCHRVKKPAYAHRQNWWYTKTIDIYIKGNIPNEYMNEIKNAYNNGITYWRNPSNFMNYSVSNGIV